MDLEKESLLMADIDSDDSMSLCYHTIKPSWLQGGDTYISLAGIP